ncbi:unnamed protein product [Dracunculus medinensis]|uniref:CRAL-TRIO domain-containing protein n=1 Tax=Dracunculus medinensis TaxID=318479 RepID=A0A0N4UK06_DRAME|nr:unnamed protein product [Dracunculus medinensis]
MVKNYNDGSGEDGDDTISQYLLSQYLMNNEIPLIGVKTILNHKLKVTFRFLVSSDSLFGENGECYVNEICSVYSPISIVGRNKINDNKIVIFELSERIDIRNIIADIQATPFMNNRFRIMERIFQKINKNEKEIRKMSSAILIIDLKCFYLNPDLINILKGPFRVMWVMWGTLTEQYPGILPNYRNQCSIIYEYPLVSMFIKKIVITSDNWKKEILKYIDPEYLPVHYGGLMRDKYNDERCRSIIAIPPNYSYPKFKVLPQVQLDELLVPADFSICGN